MADSHKPSAPEAAAGSANTARGRMVSLLIALADDPGWISMDWIVKNIEGYATVKRDSAERYVRADIAQLREYGVPVEQSRMRFRLDDAMWRLADPEFTEAEAAVVAMASRVAFNSDDLAGFAATGWGKLASVARRTDLRGADSTIVVADSADLNGEDFEILLRAAQPPRKQVQFWYAKQHGADDELRTIEPWGIANLRGRYYLAGFDVDRAGLRIYRLTRVHDVVATDTDAMIPRHAGNLQDIIERTLSRGDQPIAAIVRIAPGRCLDVVRTATERDDGTWELPPMSDAELVDVGLNYAGWLEIIEPQSAREAVIARLRAIVDSAEEGHKE